MIKTRLHTGLLISRCAFFLWTLFFSIPQGLSQPDSLLSLKGAEHEETLWNWLVNTPKPDSTAFLQQLNTLEAAYKKKKEKTLAQWIWYLRVFYRATNLNGGQPAKGIDMMLEAIEEARDRKWYYIEGTLHMSLGFAHSEHGRWGPTFENLLKGHDLLSVYGYQEHPFSRNNLYLMGLVFYKFGESKKAATYLREYITSAKGNGHKKGSYYALNTLALCYQQEKMTDSAAYFYNMAYQNAVESGDTYWGILIHGNLGQLYFEQKKYDEALPLMLEDFTGSLKNGIKGSAMNAAITLASIYLLKNDLKTSEAYLDSARNFAPYVTHPLPVSYYDTRFELHRKKGNLEEAVAYAETAKMMHDSLQRTKDLTTLDQATMKVEVERHAHEIKQLEDARQRQVLLRNTLLIILALSALIMFQFYQRLIFKRNKELQLASLNEKIARDALEQAKKDLDLYTRNLKEKNELIDAVRQEMEDLRITGAQQMDERTERLNQLLQSTILTENDWNDFRGMFEKVYPGFFTRLRQSMPDLTPADTRLLALTKLNLSSKEMASILGISSDSIKKSRQRLRRRLNLPEEGSLDELIAGL